MDLEVRKAALRAAAKTAIAFSLAGGTIALASGCAESRLPGPAPARPDSGLAVADGGALEDDGGPRAPCDELLPELELTGTDDLWTTRFASDDARHDSHVGECCLELHERAQAGSDAEIDPAVGMACCDVVVYAQGLVGWSPLGCTPWGPPCPPEAPV